MCMLRKLKYHKKNCFFEKKKSKAILNGTYLDTLFQQQYKSLASIGSLSAKEFLFVAYWNNIRDISVIL